MSAAVLSFQKRDHLTRMKQARDALRTDNIRLRQKGGLVCHSALLRDFEERRDQVTQFYSLVCKRCVHCTSSTHCLLLGCKRCIKKICSLKMENKPRIQELIFFSSFF